MKRRRTLPREQREPRWEPGWKEDATDAEGEEWDEGSGCGSFVAGRDRAAGARRMLIEALRAEAEFQAKVFAVPYP